jgi:hypothetical protein
VNFTVDPVLEFSVPRALFCVQVNVVPAGHVPPVQSGEAVNVAASPTERVAVEGFTLTDESVGVEDDLIVIMACELCLAVPLSEALRKSPTVPPALPALKVVVDPLVGLIEPSAVLARAHAYVIPVAGQV